MIILLKFRSGFRGRILAFASELPKFQRIDDVLPEHIASGTNAGNGVQVHVSHPDAQAGILLKQRLAAVDQFAEMPADHVANQELHETEQQTGHGNPPQQPYGGVTMHNVLDRDTRGDAQRDTPEVKAEVRL